MTADLDKIDALAAADDEVVRNLRLLHEPPEHHNRYPACPECALLRRYDATIRDLVAAARERDELRAAAEVVNSAFAVGWPDGGWQMTPKRITALNALEDALHRKDGAS